LYNVFGEAATPLLFYKLDKEYWGCLKAFMVFLNRLPSESMEGIPVDEDIESSLRGI
jgi:hypothetical protein